jgi:hypothetical protein
MRNPNPSKPWPAYVWGIVILLIGVFVLALMLFYSEEQTTGGLSDWPALAYMLAGKWGLAAFFLLLAAVFFGLEIRERRRRHRQPPRNEIGLDAGDDR